MPLCIIAPMAILGPNNHHSALLATGANASSKISSLLPAAALSPSESPRDIPHLEGGQLTMLQAGAKERAPGAPIVQVPVDLPGVPRGLDIGPNINRVVHRPHLVMTRWRVTGEGMGEAAIIVDI